MTDLPKAPDAERAVLGTLLLDWTLFPTLSDKVRPEHFYSEKNRIIYQAMLDVHEAGGECDAIHVIEHLRLTEKLDRAGSVPYIMGLADRGDISTLLGEEYAELVVNAARLRDLVAFGRQVQSHAQSGEDATTVHAEATSKLQELAVMDRPAGLHAEYAEEAESILGDEMGGYVPTGYSSLDRMLGGLKGLVILAGRPSQGKSTLARDILRNVSNRHRKVALFTPDQSGADIYRLEASLRSRVPLSRIKARETTPEENERWVTALRETREHMEAYFAVDDRHLTLPTMAARMRSAAAWGAEVIAIDYMQLVEVLGLRADGEFHAVTAVSKALKRIARELGIPVLCLAQLSRAVEARRDQRPMLSDLRSSGQIEQDADTIMFVYRFNPSSNPTEPVDIIVGKQKDGPIGAVQLLLRKDRTSFADM